MDGWTPLSGGNVNTVFQRGEVVRRELSAASPAVHELLKYLERRHVPLVPRLLDRDETYEYLTFLPGAPSFRPWPESVRGKATDWLTDLGRWLNHYHDAVRGFRVQDAAFLWGPEFPGREMLVCHGDIGPWNLLHQGGRLMGVIDWDLARYGDPLDDVAELALEAVPLTGRHEQTLGQGASHMLLEQRLATFCKAYGVPVETVLHHIPSYLLRVIRDVRALAATGTEPFVSFERGGIPAALEADLETFVSAWSHYLEP